MIKTAFETLSVFNPVWIELVSICNSTTFCINGFDADFGVQNASRKAFKPKAATQDVLDKYEITVNALSSLDSADSWFMWNY